jgi:hypothetical protein
MSGIILIILFAVIGIGGGYLYRDMKEQIKELKKPKQETGITMGTYIPPKTSNTGDIGISEPLTPQQVEWAAKEQLEKDQFNVQVKPRR